MCACAARVAEGTRWVGVLNHHRENENRLLWVALSVTLCACVCKIVHHSPLPLDAVGLWSACQKVIYSMYVPVMFLLLIVIRCLIWSIFFVQFHMDFGSSANTELYFCKVNKFQCLLLLLWGETLTKIMNERRWNQFDSHFDPLMFQVYGTISKSSSVLLFFFFYFMSYRPVVSNNINLL